MFLLHLGFNKAYGCDCGIDDSPSNLHPFSGTINITIFKKNVNRYYWHSVESYQSLFTYIWNVNCNLQTCELYSYLKDQNRTWHPFFTQLHRLTWLNSTNITLQTAWKGSKIFSMFIFLYTTKVGKTVGRPIDD